MRFKQVTRTHTHIWAAEQKEKKIGHNTQRDKRKTFGWSGYNKGSYFRGNKDGGFRGRTHVYVTPPSPHLSDAGSWFSSDSERMSACGGDAVSVPLMEFGKECGILTDPHSGRGDWRRVKGVEGWVSTASSNSVNKSDPHFTLHRRLTLTLARGEA